MQLTPWLWRSAVPQCVTSVDIKTAVATITRYPKPAMANDEYLFEKELEYEDPVDETDDSKADEEDEEDGTTPKVVEDDEEELL